MAPPVARAPLGRRRRRGPARLLDRLDACLSESEAQHFLGVAEGQAARLRAQHDEEKALAGAPGGDGEVVARFPGEAGLEGLHAPGILEEGNAARMHAPTEVEADSAEEWPRGGVVLHEVADELLHVLRRAALPGPG